MNYSVFSSRFTQLNGKIARSSVSDTIPRETNKERSHLLVHHAPATETLWHCGLRHSLQQCNIDLQDDGITFVGIFSSSEFVFVNQNIDCLDACLPSTEVGSFIL